MDPEHKQRAQLGPYQNPGDVKAESARMRIAKSLTRAGSSAFFLGMASIWKDRCLGLDMADELREKAPRSAARLHLPRTGCCHGVALWLRAELQTWFSNVVKDR